MSETVTDQFAGFRRMYGDRQANRPKLGQNDPESFHKQAADYGAGSERLLEEFFVGLTNDEKDELLEELDSTDPLNRAIIEQARRLYLIRE